MKNLKMLGLSALAVMALIGPAGQASASVTSPAGTVYTGTLEASITHSFLLKAGFAEITCSLSVLKGKIENNIGTFAIGKISTLSFSLCGSSTVDVLSNGSLEIFSTGAGKGDLRGYSTQITVATMGISCVYGTTTQTPIGTITGGTQPVMSIAASLPKISGGFLCANPASWTGAYKLTTPHELLVD
ncbi:MAG TPA: hypothetical protein VD761_07300 [Solirubrobacterales bacterium]|nr:hypothetical protein [Solirubrobacterales bacterium]